METRYACKTHMKLQVRVTGGENQGSFLNLGKDSVRLYMIRVASVRDKSGECGERLRGEWRVSMSLSNQIKSNSL